MLENDCLLDMSTQNHTDAQRVWIGLFDSDEVTDHLADCSCWKWLDGTPYKYHSFPSDAPRNENGREFCVEIFLPSSGLVVGTWNDNDCSAAWYAALCSMPANFAG